MKRALSVLCVLSLFLIAASAEAVTVTFDCIADTYVESYASATNNGGSNNLEVSDVYYTQDGKRIADDFRRSYTAFQDINTKIPVGATINSAYVTLYCEGFGTPGVISGYVAQLDNLRNNNTVNMHMVTSDWVEYSMTWASGQPTRNVNPPWTTTQNVGATGHINFTCTDTVLQWYASGGQKGFMFESDLDPDNLGQVYALFASHEYGVAGHRPLLTVEYTPGYIPPDPIPEPATMILLGSLATGLFGFSSIKKRLNR